jgi:hypothetical protein
MEFVVSHRLLACGGLSGACRRPSSFSLLTQREGTKRNGLWSPPTLQALALEGLGTDRTLPVRPTATPHRRRQLRPGRGCRNLLPSTRSNMAEPLHSCLVAYPPHHHSSERWNPVPWVGAPRPPLRLQDDRIFICRKTPPACAGTTSKGKSGTAYDNVSSKSKKTPHRNPRHAGTSESPQSTTPPPWPQLAATVRRGRWSNRKCPVCSKPLKRQGL